MEEFLDPGFLGPIHMINLLKFRRRALYEDGRDSDLTGEEAFNIYSRKVNELVRASGGDVTFISKIVRLEIGEAEQLWDRVILASYPSRKVMLDIMSSERMREISIHRTAGLEAAKHRNEERNWSIQYVLRKQFLHYFLRNGRRFFFASANL